VPPISAVERAGDPARLGELHDPEAGGQANDAARRAASAPARRAARAAARKHDRTDEAAARRRRIDRSRAAAIASASAPRRSRSASPARPSRWTTISRNVTSRLGGAGDVRSAAPRKPPAASTAATTATAVRVVRGIPRIISLYRTLTSFRPCPRAGSAAPIASGTCRRPRRATFNRACATHREGRSTAPTLAVLRAPTPEGIVNSLTNGRMQVQGASPRRRAPRVAQFLTGRAPAAIAATAVAKTHRVAHDERRRHDAGWNGWGNGVANTRFAPGAGLTAADLAAPLLKWASTRRQRRARAADDCGRPPLRGQRERRSARSTEDGCTHWTPARTGRHPHRLDRRPLQDRASGSGRR
jgi:hypothetical protein